MWYNKKFERIPLQFLILWLNLTQAIPCVFTLFDDGKSHVLIYWDLITFFLFSNWGIRMGRENVLSLSRRIIFVILLWVSTPAGWWDMVGRKKWSEMITI